MNISKYKRVTLVLLSIPMLCIAFLAISPIANAHTPPLNIPTYAYIQVFPNPVGVGQTLNVFAWLDKFPPTASGDYGDRWENLKVSVTKPDGNQETLGTFTSDPVGTIFLSYTPTQLGKYTFRFEFPGQTLAGNNPPPGGWGSIAAFGGPSYIGDYFMPSSATTSVVVQQQPIPTPTDTPLPSSYWTRPINNVLKGWGKISGDWLANTGMINDYSQGPETAHIMWTRPITFGGSAGGKFVNDAYYTGQSYEGYFSPPIIMNGRLYYNTATPPKYGFYCVDLRTGEEIWWRNGTGPYQLGFGFLGQNYPQLSFGQLLEYNSPNQHGVIPYLWSTYMVGTTNYWAMYDAFTGNWICTIENVPSGGAMFGASNTVVAPDGSILLYNVDLTTHTLQVWNSTRCIQNSFPSNSPFANNGYWMWRPPLGGVVNGSLGIQVNMTLPSNLNPMAALAGIDSENQIMLYSTGLAVLGIPSYPTPSSLTQFAISIKPQSLGQVLWTKEQPWPEGNVTLSIGAIGDGVYAMFVKETRQWYGFDLFTGNKLWGPTKPETELHMYGVTAAIYNGKLYSADSIGAGGTVYCYDAHTGTLVWSKQTEPMGYTGYWPNSPASIGVIADGKLYLFGFEHSPGPELEPGFKLRCMTADDGTELWNITFWAGGGFGGGLAIADGYLIGFNAYDNQIYCFGKGPSATTVAVKNDVVAKGNSVLIQGTVTDQSAGAKQLVQQGKFSIVPAIADEDMGAWMEYVYMQKPCPVTVRGVSVTLEAIGPDGRTVQIGSVMTDANGVFKKLWAPPGEGEYTVIATFKGSESYWMSYAETALGVAPSAAAEASNVNTYLLIAVLVAVIVVAALVLRRRK